jgi:hypothetical protein
MTGRMDWTDGLDGWMERIISSRRPLLYVILKWKLKTLLNYKNPWSSNACTVYQEIHSPILCKISKAWFINHNCSFSDFEMSFNWDLEGKGRGGGGGERFVSGDLNRRESKLTPSTLTSWTQFAFQQATVTCILSKALRNEGDYLAWSWRIPRVGHYSLPRVSGVVYGT